MTENSPSEEGVDSLADRAKEMLDKVKGGSGDEGSLGDKAKGLADKAKDAAAGVTGAGADALDPDTVAADPDATDSLGAAGGAAAAAGGVGGKLSGMAGKAKDAASSAGDKVPGAAGSASGAVSGATGAAGDAASGATGAAGSAASAAGDKISGGTAAAAGGAAAVAGGAAAAAGGVGGKLSGMAGKAKDAASSAGDKVSGAAGSASGAVSGATGAAGDAASGATGAAGSAASAAGDKISGGTAAAAGGAAAVAGGAAAAAGGVGGKLSGMAGKAKDAAAGAADKAKDAASSAGDKVSGAAGAVGDKVTGTTAAAAGGATAATGGVAGRAKDMVTSTVDAGEAAIDPEDAGATAAGAAGAAASTVSTSSTVTTSSTTTASVSGGGGGGSSSGGTGGGSGGSGGGGSFDDDDDDEEKLFADLPISGSMQILGIGLLTALLFLYGGTISDFFFGGDDAVLTDDLVEAADDVVDPRCALVLDEIRGSDVPGDDYSDVDCEIDGDNVILTGTADSPRARNAVYSAGAAAALGGGALLNEIEIVRPDVDEPADTAAAAPATTTTTEAETTTTTEAETTTTTEAETTTTTEAETTTTAPPAFTMWDALTGSGEAVQFATVGGALGLQDDLEALEDADGEVNRTLFAPSDEAMALLGGDGVAALAADPEGAAALVGYHFINEPLTAADLVALDGQTVQSRVGLPLQISVDGDDVIINGTTKVVTADLEADNGIVHIIDVILTPPTLNQVLDLENIEFEVNTANITAASQDELQKAVTFFTENAAASALIEGHTDTDGGDEANQALSEARAEAIKAFLVAQGLDAERFATIGFGETQPILVDGVEDKQASRRIEFKLR